MQAASREIASLVRELESLLAPRTLLRERTGYRSGVRADLRIAMAAEVQTALYDRMWVRRSVPDRRRAAFALLVDLSGSMAGEKLDAALSAVALFVEALDQLRVPRAVRGFQDEVIPFLDFDEKLTGLARSRIGEMKQEVQGVREQGHNSYQYNDDGPCLAQVAQELDAYPAEDKVLVVFSDGLPEGRRSDQDDLRLAISQIAKQTPPIDLIGIGLGPGASHVESFYPSHVHQESVAGLATRVAGLLRGSLSKGRVSHAGQGAVRSTKMRAR